MWKYPQIAESIDADTVMDIAEDIIAGFRHGDYDKVELVYTTFVSALTQEPCSLQILPVEDLDKLGEESTRQLSMTRPLRRSLTA